MCLNEEAGDTFHRILLMFLELMSVLAQRLINYFDLVREMKCQPGKIGVLVLLKK